jgi:hypothetical protein
MIEDQSCVSGRTPCGNTISCKDCVKTLQVLVGIIDHCAMGMQPPGLDTGCSCIQQRDMAGAGGEYMDWAENDPVKTDFLAFCDDGIKVGNIIR